MKWHLPAWFVRYRALPKERRELIRQTVLVLLFFVVLGIVGSALYTMQREGYSIREIQFNIQHFFGK